MSCYFVAHIDVRNAEEYRRYLDGADAVFSRYGGRYLAVDTSPEVLEGAPPAGRTVLIEFPSREELLRWYHSEDYQHLLRHRLAAADCHSLLVEGLPDRG